MTNEPDRLSEGGWSELERGFFESAPPDAPGPTPEPLRFDDLDPAPAPEGNRHRHLNRIRAAAAASRQALRDWSSSAARRVQPALARAREDAFRGAAAAWRRSSRVLGAARRMASANIELLSDRIIAMVPDGSQDRRAIVATLAALVVMMGLSAGVVASRGAGHPTPPRAAPTVAPPAAVGGGVMLCAAPLAPEPAEPGFSAFEPPAPAPAPAALVPAVAKRRHAPVQRSVAERKPTKAPPTPTPPLAPPKAAPAPAPRRELAPAQNLPAKPSAPLPNAGRPRPPGR